MKFTKLNILFSLPILILLIMMLILLKLKVMLNRIILFLHNPIVLVIKDLLIFFLPPKLSFIGDEIYQHFYLFFIHNLFFTCYKITMFSYCHLTNLPNDCQLFLPYDSSWPNSTVSIDSEPSHHLFARMD